MVFFLLLIAKEETKNNLILLRLKLPDLTGNDIIEKMHQRF
jgi:hypothetical protein